MTKRCNVGEVGGGGEAHSEEIPNRQDGGVPTEEADAAYSLGLRRGGTEERAGPKG